MLLNNSKYIFSHLYSEEKKIPLLIIFYSGIITGLVLWGGLGCFTAFAEDVVFTVDAMLWLVRLVLPLLFYMYI